MTLKDTEPVPRERPYVEAAERRAARPTARVFTLLPTSAAIQPWNRRGTSAGPVRSQNNVSMDGDPEESKGHVQGEHRTTVLWEKCIQQSIFVDLSEDESIHLSDLENSLVLHVSPAESAASEASIHLDASAELSALDDTSSGSSVVSSQSKRVTQSQSSMRHVSAQRPKTRPDEDPGQNTSDEDQEDLPYDGDLGSPYFNQTGSSHGGRTSDGGQSTHADLEGDDVEKPATSWQEDTNGGQVFDCSMPGEVAPPRTPNDHHQPDIHQLLLRHFSRDELLQTGRLIEAETLPEVSLLESADDALLSWAPTQNNTAIGGDHSESPAWNSNRSSDCGRTDDVSNTASKTSSQGEDTEKQISSAAIDSMSLSSRLENCASDVMEQERAEDEGQNQKAPFVRTRSFCEMKYGQGQVHYPPPDFSKVAPKVKIPKAPTGPARPAPHDPSTMRRAQSSPGMLDVISRVLEDSVQPAGKPHVFREADRQTAPALVHHLQAEYDKLLTKYAEAENLIDKMRLGANSQPSSEAPLFLEQHDDDQGNSGEGSHLGSLAPHIPPSENGEKLITRKELNTASSTQPDHQGPSDGEQMTAELRDIISQFMQTVEEFKQGVSSMTVSAADQQVMLRSMMEAQDQLERKYISKKEEHRSLEMQNYMGRARNTGTFDPNRLAEGDIFRIGMHLEDIKEMIDRNMCEQISPPLSSSTPAPTQLSPLCKPASTPPPSLHEGPSAGLTTSNKMETQTEEEINAEVKEASERDGGGLDQQSELITNGSLLKNITHGSNISRSLRGSAEGRDIVAAEDEESGEEEGSSVLSEEVASRDVSACLRGSCPSSTQSAAGSRSSQDGECDPADCVSLVVEVSSCSDATRDTLSHSEPPVSTSSLSQRIVSPETDSGFGSSYLSQSASGTFRPRLLSERVQNDSLSSSDSDGSRSHLQTAIHSADLTSQRWASHHPPPQTQSCGGAAAVELWVQSTAMEPSVRLQGSDPGQPAQLHHRIPEPNVSTTAEATQRDRRLCSCNSEAILALQSEVSRLKRDLEEGLVQLPHLAQKMDYLTAKYRQDRQEHRSKTRPRTHHSFWKRGSSRQNVTSLSSSQEKLEDWISSDMEPSKSKGTDSSYAASAEIMPQFHVSPVGGRRGSSNGVRCERRYKPQESLQAGADGICSAKASGLISSSLKGERANKRPQKADFESFLCKESWSLLSPPPHQRPLLQVSYGSSCSLPASYKVREPSLQPASHYLKRSTQSDTALLPSNVYFQGTLSPPSAFSKAYSSTGSKEEMNRVLDRAIEVAHRMKKTTDRMAKSLSADLAMAQLHRKLCSVQPLEGRKHHT